MQTLRKPDDYDIEVTRAYEDVVSSIKSKIYTFVIVSLKMKKSVEEIQQRFDSHEFTNNILFVTHQILQENTHAKKVFKRASAKIDKAVDELRNELFAQTIEEPQTSFKIREVYDLIRHQYFGLKKEYENTIVLKFKIQREVISPERAMFMAKNIFYAENIKDCSKKSAVTKKKSKSLPKITRLC